MRKLHLISLIAISLIACEDYDEVNEADISGKYIGVFSETSTLKSTQSVGQTEYDATADIKLISDRQIEMHCYGNLLDTTIILDYYHHNDSILVCLTGADFEEMYDHMKGMGHMSGGMMGDLRDGETEWRHHMNDEHVAGDEHFGGFDMRHNTLTYTFKMNEWHYKFIGAKQ